MENINSITDAKKYLARLALVNKDHDTRSVWTSIDRPMRPLIYQLHKIGLHTQFSCCGFPYEGEEEPKTHHGSFPYVFIWDPIKGPDFARSEIGSDVHHNFIALKMYVENLSKMNNGKGWNIRYFNDGRWHLHYNHRTPDLYNKKDGLKLSIHDYEEFVLGIRHMTNLIANDEIKYKTTEDGEMQSMTRINDSEISVIDGNRWYFDNGIEEWQVLPKQDGVVNNDTMRIINDQLV